ncbi:MAG TPA: hypothetical protein VFT61_02845, partial [Sphingomicrobium sp.]|nr:hypothetical protein [Sphingomicrobium sp.]
IPRYRERISMPNEKPREKSRGFLAGPERTPALIHQQKRGLILKQALITSVLFSGRGMSLGSDLGGAGGL